MVCYRLLTGCKALRNALTPLKTEVTLVDTIYLPQVTVDTIAVTLPVDTIVIETERVSARVIRSYDTISVEAECKADTVIVTNTVTLPTKTKVVTRVPWWFKPVVALGGIKKTSVGRNVAPLAFFFSFLDFLFS